jgi:hypothetical protein
MHTKSDLELSSVEDMFSNIFFLSCLHKNVKKIFLSYYCLNNQQLNILLLVISFPKCRYLFLLLF